MMTAAYDPQIEALRDQVLLGALPHVPFDGWTVGALRAGARDAGLDAADALRAFPRGAADAIEHHSTLADRRMLEALATQDLAGMRTRDRVALAVRTRFEQNARDREAIRRALPVLGLPHNAGMAMRCLYRTVDSIWYACGDTAADFNFYTKRALLAGVYSSALLYWLNDQSEGFADSWAFIDRRIGEVMLVPKAQADIARAFSHLPDPFRLLPSRLFRDVSSARWH